MKKLVIALFVMGIAFPSFAGLKPKNVVGTWTYELTVEGQNTRGTLKFEKDGKGLSGEVITEDGYTFPMTKVEIREGDVLYFEMEDNYAPYKASMIIDGKAYAGTVDRNGVEVPVTGKMLE
jgi:hypothetical protein